MHIAAGRGIGSIDVGVGVDPDEADALVLPAIEFGNARDGACRHGVISAEARAALVPASSVLSTKFGVLGAGRGDFFQVLRVGGAFLFLFRDGDGDVAAVFHLVPQSFEARFKSGDAHRRRPHIDAAPRLPEVERDADDADFAARDVGRRGVGEVVMKDFVIW